MKISNAKQLLAQLKQQLDIYFATHTDGEESLNEWLVAHFSQVQLVDLLQAILADEVCLTEISQRSYQHGNGFLKVVLLNHGYKLRLHIWFAGQPCEENIHDHRWSFSSLILPALYAPTASNMEERLVFLPSTRPASMGPPLTNTVGIFTLAAAMSKPGTFLSQLGTITSPSKPWARAIASVESAMSSRVTREYFIPT